MSDRLIINLNDVPVYDITYNNTFDDLGTFLDGFNASDKKCLVVTDSKVASLYLDAILRVTKPKCKFLSYFIFPEGESSKNLNVVRDIYEKLILEKFDRHDFILALGGGVTGDMSGFTAATYLRGIDFIQVPTTLLADVDSSIGGKTGVDFDSYKNMVGAFHMPKLVYINYETIKTLDEDQFYSGMGEVVKSALIKDKEFFEWLEENIDLINARDKDALIHLIKCSNIVKKNVVEKDPTEKGDRALLNLGHTIGHAVEKYMNLKLLHGQCVHSGTVMASYISMKKGYISEEDHNRIINLCKSFGLPSLPKNIDIEKIIDFTKNDKKVDGGSIKFILLKGIGEAFITREVIDDDMRMALDYYISLNI
ncbi:3-dehydroquinate synthase [Eubacterium ruminantium]|uniref:3-dehydroquinate synthase n=1 Tax=Eubacterium ruminantium TaxID=42322 RepID=A0A1T4M2M8_9FIRM|nr:3-dehydroquinate synthase [Eubacterium ruminantium]SCW37649.1 3-dehydroquinate synthase [Eubacterium ruminantium]SDM46634.1 3-dehydroquinate synthase [Eubacterium ruminantium]SJZ61028.1 3-dehydroquinate synthase [Eubacterium ruminantium]